MRPERLALGPASGRPVARSSARAALWSGTRIASVSRPAEASQETLLLSRRGRTSVSGPGQNAAASAFARASKRTSRAAAAALGTWMINGLKRGLDFAA